MTHPLRVLRAALRPVVYAAIWLLDRVVPKTRQAALAVSPDFDDQGLAIAEELRRFGIRTVWIAADRHRACDLLPWPAPPGRVVHRRSPAGYWAYLRSGYVFYTHGIFGFARPPRRKVVVNLLHGVPIKRIGLADNRRPMRATVALATSPAFQRILAESWAMPARDIPITGLPRNDRLLRARHAAGRPDLGMPYRRLILWMPTYRRSVRGEIRTDGVAEPDRPGGIEGFDRAGFDRLLAELDAACILKRHPMADAADLPRSGERLAVWDDRTLWSERITLSELIGRADLLISDASNVWVDYLLLDRPIVFAFGDIAEYERRRGFTIDGLADRLPGPAATTYTELTRAVREAMTGEDHYRRERQWARDLMHTYTDDRSAERVLSHVLTLPAPGPPAQDPPAEGRRSPYP